MKRFFFKRYTKGEISIPILIAFLIVAAVSLSGIMSPMETSNPIQGILVPVTGVASKNSLAINNLPLISVSPYPTPVPSSNSGGSSALPTLIPSVTNSSSQGAPTITQIPTTQSSMLCGTNLGLYNSSDSFLSSAQVRNLTTQALHIGTVRIPWQTDGNQPSDYMFQAAQYAKDMGLVPLIILHLETANAIAEDKQIISRMNSIFGNTLVYYELGNEPKGGYPLYITNWNTFMPQLKPLAINGKFGGPVWFENFSTTEIAGMASFIHTANPKPDFISWHEYTCGHADSAQYCFDHIGTTAGHNWSVHIQSTRNAIQANGDTVPPIFITEWNYDSAAPGGGTPDARIAPLTQMHFIQAGLNELKKDGVFAAYQYVLNTNSDYNLVNGTSLTGFGQDFAAACASL